MYIFTPQKVTAYTAKDAARTVSRGITPTLPGYEFVTEDFVELPRSAFTDATTDGAKRSIAHRAALGAPAYPSVVVPGKKVNEWTVYPAIHGD